MSFINKKTKGIVIITMLVLMIIPFVLVKTIYPFYRFGMFAEPIKKGTSIEKFLIYYDNEKGEKILFYAPNIGINVSVFESIKRNYYYRKESKKLIENIKSSFPFPIPETSHWEIYKVNWKSTQHSDTVKVFTLE